MSLRICVVAPQSTNKSAPQSLFVLGLEFALKANECSSGLFL